jgi:hypothetical protein
MPKAIMTKALPATNTKPRRIKAWDMDGNTLTTSYSGEDAYRRTAVQLCRRQGWRRCEKLVGGAVKDGYAFVFCNGR